jgi:hypothetical protein
MDYTRRLLSSKGEARLHSLAESLFGPRVHLKTRLADVFEIDLPIWSQEERTFMLMAHFDILITDDDFKPKFAIEFDGPFHSRQQQRERDNLKNKICHKAFFPLVRIGENDYSGGTVALARELKGIDRGVEAEIRDLDWMMCVFLAGYMIGALCRGKPNNDMLKQELGTYTQRFYELGYLGVTREDSYSYWHYPQMSFPSGSVAYRRYWLLTSLLAFWASSRENLREPFTEEHITELFSNLFKCAKLIEVGLTSSSFNELVDAPRSLEEDPEHRRNLVNQVLQKHPHPPDSF